MVSLRLSTKQFLIKYSILTNSNLRKNKKIKSSIFLHSQSSLEFYRKEKKKTRIESFILQFRSSAYAYIYPVRISRVNRRETKVKNAKSDSNGADWRPSWKRLAWSSWCALNLFSVASNYEYIIITHLKLWNRDTYIRRAPIRQANRRNSENLGVFTKKKQSFRKTNYGFSK